MAFSASYEATHGSNETDRLALLKYIDAVHMQINGQRPGTFQNLGGFLVVRLLRSLSTESRTARS